MTKEEFICMIDKYLYDREYHLIDDEIEEFLDSHVCIPKGENIVMQYNHLNTGWKDFNMLDVQIQFKPSEPVYECIWYYASMSGIEAVGWFTDGEAKNSGETMHKAEHTKRVRQ